MLLVIFYFGGRFMNGIFAIIVISSLFLLTVKSPAEILPALTKGAEKAASLSVRLFLVYAVWLGVYELIKSGGIGRLIAKILKKPVQFIFGKTDDRVSELLCANISANLLGIGGVATSAGIEAERLLEKSGNRYQQNALFVLASSSIQLLPLSVISLRSGLGSLSPQDIILPTLLSTAVSAACGILLTKIFYKK